MQDSNGEFGKTRKRLHRILRILGDVPIISEDIQALIAQIQFQLELMDKQQMPHVKFLMIPLLTLENILHKYLIKIRATQSELSKVKTENTKLKTHLEHYVPENEKLLEFLKKIRAAINEVSSEFAVFEKVFSDATDENKLKVIARISRGFSTFTIGSQELERKLKTAKAGQILRYVRIKSTNLIIDLLNEFESEGSRVQVTENLGDGRIKVLFQENESIVKLSGRLDPKDISIGDAVLLANSGLVTEKLTKKSDVEDLVLQQATGIDWAIIGGLETQIHEFRKKIERPFMYEKEAKLFHLPNLRGVLLSGPPGCGKSLMAKAALNNIAEHLSQKTGKQVNGYYMIINGPADVLRKYVGDSPGRVKALFAQGRERASEGHLVFVIMEEVDSWLTIRSSETNDAGVRNELVTQVNAEMDGIWGLKGVVVVALTNRPDIIDPAIIRRFNLKIEVPRPDKDGSVDILTKSIEPDVPIHPKYFDDKNYDNEGWYYPRDENGQRREGEKYHLNKDRDQVVRHFANKIMATCYDSNRKENKFIEVKYRDGTSETFTFGDFMSGDLIVNNMVAHAKELALDRYLNLKNSEDDVKDGLKLKDFYDALDKTFRTQFFVPSNEGAFGDWLEVNGIKRPPIRIFKRVLEDRKKKTNQKENRDDEMS